MLFAQKYQWQYSKFLMSKFLRKLPPMSTLRPFFLAAKHQNFTTAAEEMFITPAAISKQVRLLEEHLGVSLFTRNGRNIELTSAGRDLHRAISLGLRRIAGGTERVREGGRTNKITIAVRHTFANRFLSSRLKNLCESFPHIDFNFLTTNRNPLHLMDVSDLAVVLGHEPQPFILADHLLTEKIIPVCSPEFLNENPELKTVTDIPNHNLLHLDSEHWRDLNWIPVDWPIVLNAFGVDTEVNLNGPTFDSFDLLMHAAVSGMGVAIGWHYLVANLIEEGKLVRPVPDVYDLDREHYLLSRTAHSNDPQFQELRKWFLEETSPFR